MKKIGLIVALLATITTSCSNWLDVEPKTEIKSDIMFETEVGFKDALIGIYLVMAERDLYGRELTAGMIDVLGQQYDLIENSSGVNTLFQKYDYTSSTSAAVINSTWNKMYFAIANINNLLYTIDLRKGSIHPTHYAIIKGEALGLRAFLHFDLLRMFSYGNLAKNPAQLNDLSIPYVYDYDRSITKQSTVKQVIENVRKDLTEAQELLADFDPWGGGAQGDDYVLPNDDKFYTNRQRRFNYWAVVATQARLCMWEGNISKAQEFATSFIDSWEVRTKIKWITKEGIDGEDTKFDPTFSTEHIFQLNATKQFDYLEDLIDPTYNKPNKNINLLCHKYERASALFPTPGVGASDYRWTRLYNKTEYSFKKFMDNDDIREIKNVMPMIRMTEVYYIAAECAAQQGDSKAAAGYLNKVRDNRGVANSFTLEDSLSIEQLMKEIETEYRKEFLCEGQIFYFYKRLGYASIPGVVASTPVYKIPLPEDEVNIGGREDINKK